MLASTGNANKSKAVVSSQEADAVLTCEAHIFAQKESSSEVVGQRSDGTGEALPSVRLANPCTQECEVEPWGKESGRASPHGDAVAPGQNGTLFKTCCLEHVAGREFWSQGQIVSLKRASGHTLHKPDYTRIIHIFRRAVTLRSAVR